MVIEPLLDSGICDGQKNEQGIIIGGSGDENSESFGTSGEPERQGSGGLFVMLILVRWRPGHPDEGPGHYTV